MRFTKFFCALLSSLALAASAQVVTQVPAAKPAAPADPKEDLLREAARKALEATAPESNAPATPAAPVSLPGADPSTVTTVSLSLEEAIRLALEHNLDLQVDKYTPVISEYDRRSLYGAYDPIFTSGANRADSFRERGGINLNTGNASPGTRSEADTFSAGLSGVMPWGMTYGLTHGIHETTVLTPNQLGTNSFGMPTFGPPFRSDTYTAEAALTVAQPLLRDSWIDSTRLRIKLARRNVRIADLTFEREVMLVINNVEQAYYELIARRELIRVSEADVAVKRQQYQEDQRRVQVGTLAPLDEKLAQAELSKSEILLIDARNNAVSAENVLKALIQDNFLRQLTVRLALTDRMLPVPASFEMQEAFNQAVEKRPDLQALRLNLEKQQIQLKYDNNQLFPRLDVSATLGYNGLDPVSLGGALDDISHQRFEQSSYGLALTFPLSMHAQRNNKKATQAAIAQAILAAKRLEEIIYEEVEFQIRLVRTYRDKIPLTQQYTAYEEEALKAEKQKMAAGKSTSFNVLKIASDLASAQANEVTTLRDYNTALSELAYRKGTTLDRWHIDPPARSNR